MRCGVIGARALSVLFLFVLLMVAATPVQILLADEFDSQALEALRELLSGSDGQLEIHGMFRFRLVDEVEIVGSAVRIPLTGGGAGSLGFRPS